MKIEKIEEEGNNATFVLKGARTAVANAIRRSANSSVPTFAIDRVTFYENTSPMFDEYIAHRIGFIPIATPASGYNDKDEILFSLEATGPCTVYSKELKSADKSVTVANDNIPIIKLGNDQKLRIECKAIMGLGLKHSKFQAGFISYEDIGGESFKFNVESFGQMSPSTFVLKAVESLRDELKETEKNIKKL